MVKSITDIVPSERLWLQPSTSLLHVPVTVQQERDLEEEVKQALAFADEKLGEIQHLVQGFQYGKYVISKQIAENESAFMRLQSSPARNRVEVKRAFGKAGPVFSNERGAVPRTPGNPASCVESPIASNNHDW